MSHATLEPMTLVSEGLRLAGGRCTVPEPRGVVVFLHGIPSSAPPDPGDPGYPGLAQRFAEHGWAGAWADLRGKRGSEGYFSIEGWVTDARALVDDAQELVPPEAPTALVASSAGGAVGVELAVRGAQVSALALLASPAEWQGFAGDPVEGARRIQKDANMPISPEAIADPSEWAAEFESVSPISSIGRIEVPTLIVHGSADVVVPVEHARVLSDRAPRAELLILEDGEHQLRRDERAISSVIEWLDRVLPR